MKKKLLLFAGSDCTKLQEESTFHVRQRYRRLLLTLSGIAAFVGIAYNYSEPVLKALYGIHAPRVESRERILSIAAKYNLDTNAIVTVTPAAFQKVFKLFGKTIPEAMIFTKNGNNVEYKATAKACNAGLFSFIPALDKNEKYRSGQRDNLFAVMNDLRDMQGHKLAHTYLDNNADFYILISWTSFSGRLNKDHVRVWQSLAAGNNKAKIQIIEVNLDVQQWWPQEAQDSILKMYGVK